MTRTPALDAIARDIENATTAQRVAEDYKSGKITKGTAVRGLRMLRCTDPEIRELLGEKNLAGSGFT